MNTHGRPSRIVLDGLRDTGEEAAFRAELHAWFRDNLLDELQGHRGGAARFDGPAIRAWSRALYDGTSYKLFMAYKGALMVDDETLFRTMEVAAETGALVMVHAENGDAIDVLVKQALAAGNTAPHFHALSLSPRKGTIAPGSDADIVVFDPEKRHLITAATQHSKSDYLYEGTEVTGSPEIVLLRGNVLVENSDLVAEPGVGQFVERAAFGQELLPAAAR